MTIQLYIDNEPRNATDNATFERRSPVSGEVVAQGAAAKSQDAVAAIESAERAFASWSQTGPGLRRALLMKAAEEIEKRTEDFVLAMKAEVGAGDLWARFNVMLAANVFREAAAMTTQIQGNTIPSDKPGILFVVPSWHTVTHEADSDGVMFSYSDRVCQEKLGLWREDRGNAVPLNA